MSGLDVRNTTRQTLPRIPLTSIKEAILGGSYDLSCVFIGEKKSRALNKRFRKKDTSTNVLSFPYSKSDGEIFIDLATAKKEAHVQKISYTRHVMHLFIHGLLHLKGLSHGSTMDRKERYFLGKFS